MKDLFDYLNINKTDDFDEVKAAYKAKVLENRKQFDGTVNASEDFIELLQLWREVDTKEKFKIYYDNISSDDDSAILKKAAESQVIHIDEKKLNEQAAVYDAATLVRVYYAVPYIEFSGILKNFQPSATEGFLNIKLYNYVLQYADLRVGITKDDAVDAFKAQPGVSKLLSSGVAFVIAFDIPMSCLSFGREEFRSEQEIFSKYDSDHFTVKGKKSVWFKPEYIQSLELYPVNSLYGGRKMELTDNVRLIPGIPFYISRVLVDNDTEKNYHLQLRHARKNIAALIFSDFFLKRSNFLSTFFGAAVPNHIRDMRSVIEASKFDKFTLQDLQDTLRNRMFKNSDYSEILEKFHKIILDSDSLFDLYKTLCNDDSFKEIMFKISNNNSDYRKEKIEEKDSGFLKIKF